MKMCYSQRPPFLQLWAASTSWTVWTTSPLPPHSLSGRVTERWTLGLAELSTFTCFASHQFLHHHRTSTSCFRAALIGSNAECSVTGSLFGYQRRLRHYFLFLIGQFCQHKSESTTKASNCWDSACVLREPPCNLYLSLSSLSSGTKRRRCIWPSQTGRLWWFVTTSLL